MSEILQDIRQPGAEATRLRAGDNLKMPSSSEPGRKRIVIVGAGFAGIAAARALKRCDADVILVDRRNHHIFQPLLYQVATAVLAPSDIAAPIRQISEKQKNVTVLLAE
jgi:NADH dehydrogenase